MDELTEKDGQTLFEICGRLAVKHGLGSSRQAISQHLDDQAKALAFYTEKLGFIKKTDEPAGDARWLTLVSPASPDGVELLLEPDGHRAARPFKDALAADGIPFTQFAVDDVYAEVERLKKLGVTFTQDAVDLGPVVTAVLDDTCGNLIQIAAMK